MKTKLNSTGNVRAFLTAVFGLMLAQGAIAQTQFTNEVWISTNATGKFYGVSGASGTLTTPLDGSTAANFDSNMGSLPPNCTVHILAGTYQTGGQYAWQIKSGQKILGSGKDVTILQLPNGTGDNDFVLYSTDYTGVTNVEVCDLTCDCNYTSGTYTYHGIFLDGTHNAVRRVKVIHQAKMSSSNSESWGIVVGGITSPNSSGNVIEDCEVSNFKQALSGTGFTALNMGFCAGTIRNNTVLAVQDPVIGVNSSYVNGLLIEGNYFQGCGYYADTGGTTNVTVIHNIFKNTQIGVNLVNPFFNAPRMNMTFAHNTVSLSTNGTIQIGFNFSTTGGTVYSNFNILGNTVVWDGASTPNGYFVDQGSIEGLHIADNRVAPGLLNEFWGTDTTNISIIHDNYDLRGVPLSINQGPTTIYKPADQNIGTTLTDVTNLSFFVAANSDYGFDITVIVTTSGSATYTLALNGPSSPTELSAKIEAPSSNSTDGQVRYGINTYNSEVGVTSGAGPGSTRVVARIVGTLRNGANAGIFTVRGKANSGTLTIHRGSWGQYLKLSSLVNPSGN